jgi:hypothetical protein
MSSESVAETGSDPLKAVADAMDAAVKAAKEGAEEARATVADSLPAARKFVSRSVYNTCYAISYGVVFPTMLIVRMVPKDNAVVHGLVDGARAATDMVDEMKARSSSGEASAT